MKPKTAAAHMIISGARLPCLPDPVCVCCENNRHCEYFIPITSRQTLVPHRSKGSRESSQICNKVQQCLDLTHTCEHIWSTLSPSELWTSWRVAYCPLLTPLFVLCSPHLLLLLIHTPHLHPFSPLPLYLLLCCSSTCPHRVHLSDPVTMAARRQIASKPTNLNIALLSALLDQIAFTVHQQTR